MDRGYPELLEQIIEFYKKLPGIGEKSAERYALATINLSTDDIENYSVNLVKAKKNLQPCSICGHLTDQEVCNICSDENRHKSLVCVIEDYKSVFSFEKGKNYQGVYHVLNGLISPMDDIGVEDINISGLISRVNELENPELILALKPSIEGETTTLYIKKIFENKDVKISRLSYGLPMGADIDYIDTMTLDKALNDRKVISE